MKYDEDAPYTFDKTQDAVGTQHTFHGPGLPLHAHGVHFMQPMNEWATKHASLKDASFDAEQVCRFLNIAFEAGRQDMAAQVRVLLGVHK